MEWFTSIFYEWHPLCVLCVLLLAHQLQLARIAAAREVSEVHEFFKDLIFIMNTVSYSSNRHDELQES